MMLITNLLLRANATAQPVLGLARQLFPLGVRLWLGSEFVQTGMGKWSNFQRTVDFFRSLGIPAPLANAAFVSSLELVGGAALVVGFGTRIFAALLSSTMVVALMTADHDSLVRSLGANSDHGPFDIAAFCFLVFLLFLTVFGPGALSADRFLARRLGLVRPQGAGA